ncbi:Nucleotidyl transferase AbiEii toxin, Type IV TA system [Anaerosphaera aminiphila DSM 21120]|uniref:Nucleotidyl transferase AbiEii toxin, Type IV TA system n=1 Tax=Anaerosphaera aminiphila DSM 21120 TaxID=1120995 RepID=A0A1M5PL54_9FIRM|nr:nucleotidyl transferase AbiEii/AbiGii toxin family protein [Anaerosphaera aminiphila]SHH02451.1 Nucleotidyl transferase AbiEii toxin, Type IV TA system [Anaerosphaera aminiphila DSM 21120]
MGSIELSVLARLKNKSKERKIPLQQLLNLFCQEEFLRRLSKSKHRDQLILKGGFLLYSISGFTTRPTVDSDYLLKGYSNNIEEIEELVIDIIESPTENDFIKLKIRTIEINQEIREYSGARINLEGTIGRTKTPFSIDFGVGDIVVPSYIERIIPVILGDFEKPKIFTYSLESTIAEKLDSIISLMGATSRMKDFYDIYYLATNFDFEGKQLKNAIYKTLSNRSTPYNEDSIQGIRELGNDEIMQKRWNNFCDKVLGYKLDFSVVLNSITKLIEPPFESIVDETKFTKKWGHAEGKYE